MATDSTLHDVAALAGVSPRTVSRVVNDEGGFGEATRLRVVEAIEKVGYRPNLLARALITRRTNTIGLVVPEMTDPFFAELAEGVQAAARIGGRTMFIASHGGDLAVMDEILATLSSFAVDGAIVFTPKGDRASVMSHAARGLRCVVIDMEVEGPNLGSIVSTIRRGAELAVEHLVAGERRNLAMITNAESSASLLPPRRESGFRTGLHVAGLPFDERRIVRQPATIEGGRAGMETLLLTCPDVDGVLAYNDSMAIGALQALASAGRRVPEDVALIGFDDIAICSALVPALTTIRMDRTRIGREAVALLDRLASDPAGAHPPVLLDVELVVRDSA
jgi:LacI family transcriptional regulator